LDASHNLLLIGIASRQFLPDIRFSGGRDNSVCL